MRESRTVSFATNFASSSQYPLTPTPTTRQLILRGDFNRPFMTPSRARARTTPSRSRKRSRRTARPKGFVGRDASPVLERYPAKDPSLAPRGPPVASAAPPSAPSPPVARAVPAAGPTPTAAPPAASGALKTPSATPLITLDRPFDLDGFSSLLGETSIRVTVPRDDLPELLRRVLDFMGFGIYVYSISVRPAPTELLKSFVVELRRVDFHPEKGSWEPFVEKGVGDSPYSDRSAPP